MSPIDTARVAEIIVRSTTKAEYGSGYRISSRLILTVAHLLRAGGEAVCTVLLGGGDLELPATLVWQGARQDLALLRLEPGIGSVPPTILGSLPDGVGSVPFNGVGFPAFAQRPGSEVVQGLRRRDSRQVNGSIQLGSNMKSGLLDLTFTTAAPVARAPGGPDPWQGFSGTALFAQDGGLLVAVQAQRLPAAGTSSAEAESVAVALRDPEFRSLLVSNGIRAQAVPVTLAGHEPQNRLRAVASQRELIEGFSDFKKNLTPERLPFVSPGGDHPAEPQNLFERLVASADRGVLLVGAAGTGKTRTGIEVGRLALEAGWRVLHVLPGEDESVTDQIAEQVLAEPSAVLVVVDYLNESLLDLPALRHRLIPEAHRRGIPVALLASVRPGWLNKADRALLHGLFDEVELRQDGEFQRLVTDNALTTLAPTAIIRLGPKRMLAACGHRPIIALLVASWIERRVKAGLAVPEAADLRSGGELPAWLERRLSEDSLVVPAREDDFIPARASHALVAAAAAAGACPQSRAEVVVAARAALDGAVGKVPDAEDIVATLVSLGWLELDNGALSVAHDVVADQFMESVILPERDADPDLPRTRAMLAGCLTSPRTVGSFAVNISRLVNDLALAGRADPLYPVFDSWFADNALVIGDIMRRDSGEGSYALGAICSRPPWHASLVRCWQQVAGPWLVAFGADINARHLLYSGLRNLPANDVALIIPTAMTWLSSHGRIREASYVLNPLLSRADLTPGDSQRAVSAAFAWLDQHATALDAQFVLKPLLSRADLTPGDSQRAVSAAFAWLDQHATASDAGFVLPPLLSRADLTPGDSQRAVSAAFAWLDQHATAPDADFVIGVLLKCLSVEEIPPVLIEFVDTWISEHVPEQDFLFLSKWVLRKRVMSRTIFEALLSWAQANPDSEDLINRLAAASSQVEPYIDSRENFLRWMRTIELCFDYAERQGPASNLNGALDVLIFCLSSQFRTGVAAAWADDYIQRWVALPFSMSSSVFRPNKWIVRRCHAMALSGRFDKEQAATIGARLRRWVSQWHRNDDNDEALAFIDAYMCPNDHCGNGTYGWFHHRGSPDG